MLFLGEDALVVATIVFSNLPVAVDDVAAMH
jgi:hypothetical protein